MWESLGGARHVEISRTEDVVDAADEHGNVYTLVPAPKMRKYATLGARAMQQRPDAFALEAMAYA